MPAKATVAVGLNAQRPNEATAIAELLPVKATIAPLSLTATDPPVIAIEAMSAGSGAVETPGVVELTVPSHGWPAGLAPMTTAPSPSVAIE
jgi:hypothetical protein